MIRHKEFPGTVIEMDPYPGSKNIVTKFAKALFWGYILLRNQTRTKPYNYLFVLSPARAGSSLTQHILNTNPDISGFGESHVSYSSEKDLLYLALRTGWVLKKFRMNESYYMDKIVLDHHTLSHRLLESELVNIVFLLRNPLDNIASILKTWPDVTEDSIRRYYGNRLAQLEKYAKVIDSKERCFFLTYEQLLNNAEAVLEALQTNMGIDHKFLKEYDLIPAYGYGEMTRGDPSKKLQEGEIVKNRKRDGYDFNTKFFQESVSSYHKCYSILYHYCSTY